MSKRALYRFFTISWLRVYPLRYPPEAELGEGSDSIRLLGLGKRTTSGRLATEVSLATVEG